MTDPTAPGSGLTPIDRAHAALAAAEDDAGLRLAFYGAVLASEILLLLEDEAEGDRVRPFVVETGAGRLVLAFDTSERMASFLDRPRDYLALSGRALFTMLEGQGIGIALNPDVAPSASVIPPAAIDAMATAPAAPDTAAARLARFRPPADAPSRLVEALAARMAAHGGLIAAAHLVTAEDAGGGERLLLALEGVPEAAEAAVARAMDEALRFSGVEGVGLDILYPTDSLLARLRPVALTLRPEPAAGRKPVPPGADPARPPRLR
jgi:hypothetical protein